MFLRRVKEQLSPRIEQLLRWYRQRQASQSIIGLDIGPDVIRLLKINLTITPYQVENFAIAALPPGIIEKEEIKNFSAVANIIKSMVSMSDVKTKFVALAISRSSVVIKNVIIDSRLNSTEIESRAWLEANRLSADLVGDIYLDFNTTPVMPPDPAHLDLNLIACRKDHIKSYVDVLKQSGLIPKVVDVNCFAIERALSHWAVNSSPNKTIACLNLNFTLSSLVVIQDNQLLYAHDHSYDGRRLKTQILRHLKIEGKSLSDPIEARVLVEDPIYADILRENLSAHLRHIIHFFFTSRPNVSIQQLVLAGDCADIPNIAEFVKRETNIDTIIANPFVNMEFAPGLDIEKIKANAPSLMQSCGLALTRANPL